MFAPGLIWLVWGSILHLPGCLRYSGLDALCLNLPASDCRFRQALAEALKVNASIANISLEHNYIGDAGAKAWRVVGRQHAS